MSHRYAAAALNLDTRNRFAVFDEEEEGAPRLPPAAPTRVPSVRSLPPLPKIVSGSGSGGSSGGGGGGGGAGAAATSGGSYGDRLRARKAAAGATAVSAAPNLESQREFPSLGGGKPAAAPAHSSSSSTARAPAPTSSWASMALACAEQDAREKEARAAALAEHQRRLAMEENQFLASRVLQFNTRDTISVDHEEDERLRGLPNVYDEDGYMPAEMGSHTPPYPPYDEEEGAGPVEEGAGDEEHW